MVHGGHVVDDLIDIFGAVRGKDVRLSREQVLQGALRALDLAGEHGFFPHIHEDEKVGIGKRLDGAIKATQSAIRQ